MQIIIFPSRGSNRGSLKCQAYALTTVLLSLLHYPLYVSIIYLRLLQEIALHRTSINLALHTNIVQIRIHCAYQKIHVFSLIPNFSLQLASIAVLVAILCLTWSLTPNTDFLMPWSYQAVLKEYIIYEHSNTQSKVVYIM